MVDKKFDGVRINNKKTHLFYHDKNDKNVIKMIFPTSSIKRPHKILTPPPPPPPAIGRVLS